MNKDTEPMHTKSAFVGWRHWAALALAAMLASGCAGLSGTEAPVKDEQACRPANAADPWIGNWLGINKRKGVAGELHVLMTLHQDGSMAYAEQLKRAGKPPQTLNETGCWHRTGETLVLRTTHSNAVAVEQGDPIYVNEYETQQRGGQLVLHGPESPLSFKRMPGDYRLPVF